MAGDWGVWRVEGFGVGEGLGMAEEGEGLGGVRTVGCKLNVYTIRWLK